MARTIKTSMLTVPAAAALALGLFNGSAASAAPPPDTIVAFLMPDQNETVQNLGEITPLCETDVGPIAPRRQGLG